jgi:hypothetical protein
MIVATHAAPAARVREGRSKAFHRIFGAYREPAEAPAPEPEVTTWATAWPWRWSRPEPRRPAPCR